MENYFNYFTEIEECYRQRRSTPTLLSPLDWALIESWKAADLPLEAVLVGIERAFTKFNKRPKRFRLINGLAYCAQSVFAAAEELKAALVEGGRGAENKRAAEVPFTAEEIQGYFKRNAEALERASDHCRQNDQQILAEDLREAAATLGSMAAQDADGAGTDLEELERRLSALEDKLTASVTRASSVERLAQLRREVERGLVRCRREMTGAQIEALERQFLKKRLFEHYRIPRLSLFYL